MLSPELLAKVHSSDSDGDGCTCNYYKLGDGKGLKVYKNRFLRDEYYYMQNAFAGIGYAPKTFAKFDIDNDGETLYTYVTEEIETVVWTAAVDEEIRGMEFYFKNVWGIDAADLFYKNVGLKNEEYIPLDFGAFYIVNWELFRDLLLTE